MSLKLGFRLNHAISLCRKSGAGGLPANYPEPGHEGILTAMWSSSSSLFFFKSSLNSWNNGQGNAVQISALSILRPSRASTSGLYIPSRLWRKLATQFSSVKPREARSPRSRGSRTRCPSTSRPTPDWAWWSKVNCEVRRRWQFGRSYIRIPLNILSNFLENNHGISTVRVSCKYVNL